MKISVIIPVYNRCDELRMSLQSLTCQSLPVDSFEVCLADDGSAEDVCDLLDEFPTLNMKYARQPDEGFRVAAARNLGADMAEGEYWVYNDNGMMLRSNALERHIACHEKYGERLVALGNMHGTGWGVDELRLREIIDTHAPDYDKVIDTMKEEDFVDGRTRYILDKFGYDIDSWYLPWMALWSGHFSVNSAFVKKHGIRWSEQFRSWGGEDFEYGIQLCKAGATMQFCADVEAVHYPTPGSKAVDPGDKEEFRRKYQVTKDTVLSLHPDSRQVQAWYELGGGANETELREQLFKEKGWK